MRLSQVDKERVADALEMSLRQQEMGLRQQMIKQNSELFGLKKKDEITAVPLIPVKVKKVIFNNPATIVLWEDGTKTVVKCMDGDTFSQEMGLAMCICKKVLGSQYHKVFKEWITYESEQETKSKYKVGDKVRFWSKNRSRVGTIVDDDGSEHMQYTVKTKEGRCFYCYGSREETTDDTWYIEGLADE